MTRLLAAVGTVALLTAGAAFGQTQTDTGSGTEATASPMVDNQGSLDVIQEQLQAAFTRLGVDVEVGELTMDQARQAYLIVSSDSLTEGEQVQQIEAQQQQ